MRVIARRSITANRGVEDAALAGSWTCQPAGTAHTPTRSLAMPAHTY